MGRVEPELNAILSHPDPNPCFFAKRPPIHSDNRQMQSGQLWDIFCTVIDNHGDLGVCWRLTRQLRDAVGGRRLGPGLDGPDRAPGARH